MSTCSGSPDHGQRFIEAGAMGLRGLAQAVPAALHYRRGIETAAGPSLDRAMAEEFLGHFPPASHCFQLFADTPNGPRTLARTMHGTLGDVWPHLAALNEQGAGVYFTPNEVTPGAPRRAEYVRRVRAFFADSDNPACLAEVEAAIARRGVPPSLAVETSPGKRHFYWLLDDQCRLADFKPTQQAIAAALGTDPSVCDLPRVMRLPGFFHRKGEPFLVRVISP